MNEEIENLIEETAQITVENTIEKIRRDLMRDADPKSVYVRTEVLLYNYPDLLQEIREKSEELAYFQKHGMPQKSKSISSFYTNSGCVDTRSEYEKQEDQMGIMHSEIAAMKDQTAVIDAALSSIREDPYYPVIELKYFRKKTISEICDKLSCNESAVRRHKNRLLGVLQWALFKDDIMEEMLKWLVE